MGVESIFTAGEFNKFSFDPLKVAQIKHKALIEVDKEGTTGAAATGIELVPFLLSESKEIIIDSPFIFIVRDKRKNVPLFIGRIVDPTSK